MWVFCLCKERTITSGGRFTLFFYLHFLCCLNGPMKTKIPGPGDQELGVSIYRIDHHYGAGQGHSFTHQAFEGKHLDLAFLGAGGATLGKERGHQNKILLIFFFC